MDIAAMVTTLTPYALGVTGALLGIVGIFALAKWVQKRVKSAIR